MLKILLLGFLFSVLLRGVAPVAVFSPVFLEDQIVFATLVVTNADPSGRADATAAINQAMLDVQRKGGGVCFLPAGFYRCDGSLVLRAKVTLQGEWRKPVPEEVLQGTVLMAYPGRGTPDGDPFIWGPSSGHADLKSMAIWYPEQTADPVVPYPYTIKAHVAHIRQITLVNSYRGIHMAINSGSVVSDIYGTVLETGIWTQKCAEFARLHKVHFSPDYWCTMQLPGDVPVDAETVEQFVSENLTALHIGRSDGLSICHVDAPEAKVVLDVSMSAEEKTNLPAAAINYGLGGVVWDVPGRRIRNGWDAWYFGSHYADLDQIPELPEQPAFPSEQHHPARMDPTSIFVATAPEFGALGDGRADDTFAIQRALNAAGVNGGGTVYLPHGVFRVTAPLTVPEGVELRGVMGTGQIRLWYELCTLLVDWIPAASEDVFTAPAAVTLCKNAGVRGLTIGHTINIWETDEEGALKITPTSYTLRASSTGTYIQDVILANSYLGIDLASSRCDNFQIKDLWATALREGIRIGGGTQGGSLEIVTVDVGPWTSWTRKPADAVTTVYNEWIHDHLDLFVFENCSNIRTFSLAGWYPKRHVVFRNSGGGKPENIVLQASLFDVAKNESIRIEDADNIDFIGLFATGGGNNDNWIAADAGFSGRVAVYGSLIQPRFVTGATGGISPQFSWTLEHSLTTGRTGTDGSEPVAEHPAAHALDGDVFTWWQFADPPEQGDAELTVDLGAVQNLDRWRVVGHGVMDQAETNPSAATLLVSSDGLSFVSVDSFEGNSRAIVERPLPDNTSGRFVRLRVDKGTAPQEDGRVRIHLFDVFGNTPLEVAP
jgi:hypothetical protein